MYMIMWNYDGPAIHRHYIHYIEEKPNLSKKDLTILVNEVFH